MTRTEPILHHLEIDWHQYAPESELFLDEVHNRLWSMSAPSGRRPGTSLVITDLNDVWTFEKLQSIANDHLSKLMNPFFPAEFQILPRFNRDSVDLLQLQQDILSLARLHVAGEVDPAHDPPLQYTLTYKSQQLQPVVKPVDQKLPPPVELAQAGPFRFELYEFDRDDPEMEKLGRKTIAGHFLDTWGGGGLMLFRDGFRVMPYGAPGNDWLGIDKRFFSRRGGTRLRTHAMTGYVAITSACNPRLIDQTNREGLRENEAYAVFRVALERVVDLVNLELEKISERSEKAKHSSTAKWSRSDDRAIAETRQRLTVAINDARNVASELRTVVRGQDPAEPLASRLTGTIEQLGEVIRTYEGLGDRLQKYLSLDSARYQTLLVSCYS